MTQEPDPQNTTIGVIGLGYVGLPLARSFCDAGFRVIGFDVDKIKIDMLERGETYLQHLGADYVSELRRTGRFDPTDDFDRLAEADAIFICVPTPLDEHHQPDLSYVINTTEQIARTLRRHQLVVLESTTYPGTTREELLPRLEATGLKCGEDFYLAFSPEREDPGRIDMKTSSIPKLVGGIDLKSGEIAESIYRRAFANVIHVEKAEIAEAAKLLENIYRAVNIALVNEMKTILSEMDVDIWQVVEAAATKPFGFQAFYPGPGLGGHCIPIDPFYMTHKARQVGHTCHFIELAGEVNREMPARVVQQVVLALNEQRKPTHGSRILVIGLAYKPNVDDTRESPSFELITRLRQLGAEVEYHDPHVPAAPVTRRHDLQISSVDLTPDTLATYDCILIATHHDACDWQMIGDHAKLVVDTRGVMRKLGPVSARVYGA